LKIFIYLYYFLRSASLRGLYNTIKIIRSELEYEKQFGIKTAKLQKSESDEFFHYQGASYLVLFKIFDEIKKDTTNFEFIDIGCGKGRAVFVAEYAGYNQLKGIELRKELVEEAMKNLGLYKFKRPESTIEFICENALEYSYQDIPTVYFFFNPFNEDVMDKVLSRILASSKSETWFVYMNPLFREPFEKRKIQEVKRIKTKWYIEAVVYRLERSS
jgi:SAM-dependent methyltransferase